MKDSLLQKDLAIDIPYLELNWVSFRNKLRWCSAVSTVMYLSRECIPVQSCGLLEPCTERPWFLCNGRLPAAYPEGETGALTITKSENAVSFNTSYPWHLSICTGSPSCRTVNFQSRFQLPQDSIPLLHKSDLIAWPTNHLQHGPYFPESTSQGALVQSLVKWMPHWAWLPNVAIFVESSEGSDQGA